MFSFGKEVHSYWQSFIRLVYPASCPVCEIPLLLYEPYLCSSCTLKIKAANGPKCAKCARILPPYGPSRHVCTTCTTGRPFYHRGFALVKYESPIKTIFHEIKFQNKPWLLKVFAAQLKEFAGSFPALTTYDMMIPVPLDSKKARERSFNQARIIAQMLKRSVSENKIEIRNLIKKKKKTLPQSQLRRRDRLKNLIGAFSIKNRAAIKGKHILVVDDIFTTGSTVNECARLLKENGAERVDFFTLARS
jgi:ComF family protein